MMATRFRSMGLVAAVGAAALGCYMVSLRVAAERFALVRIEGKVLSARLDIRRLQTELGTRGRLVQLERWNDDVLALSAPKAAQYVDSDIELASYAKPAATLPGVIEARAIAPAPAPAPVQTVAYVPAPTPAPIAAPAKVQNAAYTPAPAETRAAPRVAAIHPAALAPALLHEAAYVKPAAAAVRPAAYVKPPVARTGARKASLLDDGLLRDIGKAASAEAADRAARR